MPLVLFILPLNHQPHRFKFQSNKFMLEIIALFFLCKQMGRVAKQKGQSAGKWKLFTVLGWFAAEITGFIAGAVIFGTNNLIGLALLALVSAVGGYLLVKAQLDKLPDEMEDEIERIGE
jgi:hypothetical protein